MKKILVPCDFSDPAVQAFKFAVDVARQAKGAVMLLMFMAQKNMNSASLVKYNYLIIKILSLCLFLFPHLSEAQKHTAWKAPQDANELKNPTPNDAAAVVEGEKIYQSMCAVCHGDAGKGNGVASVALDPHPANFLNINVINESDGAIFWKLTEGRPPMASYKTLLTEKQRWELVCYIRKLEEKK